MGLTLPMKVEDELVLVLPLASVTDSTLQVLPEGKHLTCYSWWNRCRHWHRSNSTGGLPRCFASHAPDFLPRHSQTTPVCRLAFSCPEICFIIWIRYHVGPLLYIECYIELGITKINIKRAGIAQSIGYSGPLISKYIRPNQSIELHYNHSNFLYQKAVTHWNFLLEY